VPGLTRRRFVQGAAGAGVALSLPALRPGSPPPLARASEAVVPGYRDADYWAFADAVAPLVLDRWDEGRGHYGVPGGGETSFNADMLYVHAAAAREGRTGPVGNRARTGAAGGGAFVVFGRRSPRDVDLRALGSRGIEIRSAGPDWAGFAVAAARRVDGDRLGDVALLARGSLVVVRGRRAPGTIRLDAMRPAAGLRFDGGVEPNQWYSDDASGGFITAGAVGGDANGDGTADLLAGVRMADHHDRPDSGSAYVLFSPPAGAWDGAR